MKLADLFEKKTSKTAWVILFTPNKLILGKRAPSTNNPNQWNFFGGHVDDGESAVQAAIREIGEEIKLKVDEGDLKQIAEIGNATYFSMKIDSAGGSRTTDEISAIKGFKLTELPDNLHSKTQNFFDRLENLLA